MIKVFLIFKVLRQQSSHSNEIDHYRTGALQTPGSSLELLSDYDESTRDQNEQRLFNLYRYYLSQYPELFEPNRKRDIDPDTGDPVAESNPSLQRYLNYCDQRDSDAQLLQLEHLQLQQKYQQQEVNKLPNKHRKCCFGSRCCQSDSSLWSVSELDWMNQQAITKPDVNCLSDHEERYAHLSRVITPPNAFLTKKELDKSETADECTNKDCVCYLTGVQETSPQVRYSNKVTQTDAQENRKYQKLQNKKLLKQLSLTEPKRYPLEETARLSMDSDHIYYTIFERQPQNFPEDNVDHGRPEWVQTPLNMSPVVQSSQQSNHLFENQPKSQTNNRKMSLTKMIYRDPGHEENGSNCHRIPTSKDGIPCSCNQCRESRGNIFGNLFLRVKITKMEIFSGLNLTTELLPLDTQIPLQMDHMDSLDSAVTELICTIL